MVVKDSVNIPNINKEAIDIIASLEEPPSMYYYMTQITKVALDIEEGSNNDEQNEDSSGLSDFSDIGIGNNSLE